MRTCPRCKEEMPAPSKIYPARGCFGESGGKSQRTVYYPFAHQLFMEYLKRNNNLQSV